jgi:hypothetical protein
MADPIDPEVSERLKEALLRFTEGLSGATDALSDFDDGAKTTERKLDEEFKKLGLTLRRTNEVEDSLVKKKQDRVQIEEELNEKLRKSGKVREDASEAEVEHYKQTQKQNVLFETTLASMGRYIDANNKIIKSTVDLSAEQQKTIKGLKEQDAAQGKLQETLTNFGKDVGIAALKIGFEALSAVVIGSYKGLVAYQNALLDGQKAASVAAAKQTAELNQMAAGFGNVAGILQGLAGAAAGVALVVPQFRALAAAAAFAAGILSFWGKTEEERLKREGEMVGRRGKLVDELFENFEKLSQSSLTGADGMEGVRMSLNDLSLTMKEFEKFGKVLQENTRNLGMFGAGTVNGVKKFEEVTRNLIYSDLGKTLRILGIGIEDQMSHAASFMTQQAKFGIKLQGDQTKAVGAYIGELDKLAVLTGVTRKEQEDGRKAALAIKELRFAMLAEEDPARKAELQRTVELLGPMLARGLNSEAIGIAKVISGKGAGTPEGAFAMQRYGGQGGVIEGLQQGGVSTSELYLRMLEQSKAIEKLTASTAAITGGGSVNTKNIAELMDAIAATSQIPKGLNGEQLNKLLTRTVKDKTTEDYVTAEQLRRKNAITDETLLYKEQYDRLQLFGDAVKRATERVDQFIKPKEDPKKAAQDYSFDNIYGNDKPPPPPPPEPAPASVAPAPAPAPVAPAPPPAPAPNNPVSKADEYQKKMNTPVKKSAEPAPASVESPPSAPVPSPSPSVEPKAKTRKNDPKEEAQKTKKMLPLSFLSGSGGMGNFDELDSSFKDDVFSAAQEYYNLTGQPLLIISSKRSSARQKELWDARDPKTGLYQGRPVAAPGSSLHETGQAVDIQNYSDKAAIAALKKYGLVNNISNDKPHFQKGKYGGIFDGPNDGYLVEMHGREKVEPLNTLEEKMKAGQLANKSELGSSNNNSGNDRDLSIMFSMMENKFDEMIRKLDTGNDYSDKLVKAMA